MSLSYWGIDLKKLNPLEWEVFMLKSQKIIPVQTRDGYIDSKIFFILSGSDQGFIGCCIHQAFNL